MRVQEFTLLLIVLYLKCSEARHVINLPMQCESQGNKIIRFQCASRGLTSLEEVFPKRIDKVYSLDVSDNELNNLKGLENVAVSNLKVSHNHISALPRNLLGGTLSSLEASHNTLTSLDISDAVNVWSLSVHSNSISEFHIPRLQCSLRFLDISRNRLKYLPSMFDECRHLYFLNASRNMIHSLPVVLIVTKKPWVGNGLVFVDLRTNPLPDSAVLAALEQFISSHGPLSLAVNKNDCGCAKLKSLKGLGRTMLELCVTSMCINSVNLWKIAVFKTPVGSNADSIWL